MGRRSAPGRYASVHRRPVRGARSCRRPRGRIMNERDWIAATFVVSVAAYAVLIYWSSSDGNGPPLSSGALRQCPPPSCPRRSILPTPARADHERARLDSGDVRRLSGGLCCADLLVVLGRKWAAAQLRGATPVSTAVLSAALDPADAREGGS